MAVPFGNGVPLDPQSSRVAITQADLLLVAAVDFGVGGMSQPGMCAHLRVVDIPSGKATFIPLPLRVLESIAAQVDAIVQELQSNPTQ